MCNIIFMSFDRRWWALSNTCHCCCLFVITWSYSTLGNTYLDDRICILVDWASSCASTRRVLSKGPRRASCHTSSIYSFFPWNPDRIIICIIWSNRATGDTSPSMRISKIIRSLWTSSNTFICRIIRKIWYRTFSYTSISCLISKS